MSRCRLLLSLAAGLMLGLPAAGADEARVITLPPFLVEEAAGSLPWRYAEVAGWEVLSSCPERLTRELIANHYRLEMLLGELLPPGLQLKMTAPRTLFFVDSAQLPLTSQEVMAQLALTSAEQERLADPAVPLDDGRLRRRPPPPRYTFLPNLRLWDRDTGTLFAIVREREFNASRVGLTPDYVAYVMRNRLPALPPWFASGVLTLFVRAEFTEDALTLGRLDWPAAAGSAALSAGPEANQPLLPLAEFFAGNASPGDGMLRWQAQAALLVHWGLGGRGAPRRAALWNFAARAAVEPVTETLFRECFGLDFAGAQEQLAAHLPEAMQEKLALRPRQRPRVPDYRLRPADEVEIARLKGDWERLEIGYVKTHFPALGPKYLAQARRTLMRAYERGSRDPRLLAVMGLCEIDAGNDAAAREFLEAAAARSKALRPRAWFELARLRFATLGAGRAGAATGLRPEEVVDVLAALAAAREQDPPLPEVYDLLAEVWAACAQAPTRLQLAVLEEGVRLFPHRPELIYRTAELNLRHGYSDTARWLIALGLTVAPDAAARTRLEALQARVNAGR